MAERRKKCLAIVIAVAIMLFAGLSAVTVIDGDVAFAEGDYALYYGEDNAGDASYITVKSDGTDGRLLYGGEDSAYEKYQKESYTRRIYVKTTAKDEISKITYDRIELDGVFNYSEIKVVNGEFVGKTPLDDDVVVNMEDLKETDSDSESKHWYFEVKTDRICGWAFTVYYKIPGESDQKYYGNAPMYCTKVDNKKPDIILAGKEYNNKVKYTYRFSEAKEGTAISGISRIIVYKKKSGSDDYDIYYERKGNGLASDVCEFELERERAEYFLEVVDIVGNTTGKVKIAEFTTEVYDAAFESNLQIALDDLAEGKYSETLYNGFLDAYFKYITVTRDEMANADEKTNAKNAMRKVYDNYREAKSNAESGVVNAEIEIINGEYMKGFKTENSSAALGFLPYGEEPTLTLTLARFDYASVKDAKKEALSKTELKEADTVYCITINLTKSNGVRASGKFSVPLTFKFEMDTDKDISATQVVYNTYGTPTYYDCTVVRYADGTIAVSAPQASGVVNIFIDEGKDNKNLYWLFSLTAIPVFIGVLLLVITFRKIKKIKESALNNNENGSENGSENNEKEERIIPKNKSKRKIKHNKK